MANNSRRGALCLLVSLVIAGAAGKCEWSHTEKRMRGCAGDKDSTKPPGQGLDKDSVGREEPSTLDERFAPQPCMTYDDKYGPHNATTATAPPTPPLPSSVPTRGGSAVVLRASAEVSPMSRSAAVAFRALVAEAAPRPVYVLMHNPRNRTRAEATKKLSAEAAARAVLVTDAEIEALSPVVWRNIVPSVPGYAMAVALHPYDDAALLWFHDAYTGRRHDFLWSIEPDVRYGGDWGGLFGRAERAAAASNSSLVVFDRPWAPNGDWGPWGVFVGPTFAGIPMGKRRHNLMVLAGYGAPLMAEMSGLTAKGEAAFVEQFAPTLAHVYGLGTLYVVHARAAQGDGTFCVRCNKGPVKYEASWRASGDCRVPLLLHPVKT